MNKIQTLNDFKYISTIKNFGFDDGEYEDDGSSSCITKWWKEVGNILKELWKIEMNSFGLDKGNIKGFIDFNLSSLLLNIKRSQKIDITMS